jgi:hypothetical protein
VTQEKATGGKTSAPPPPAQGTAALGEGPAPLALNLTGRRPDVPGWVDTLVLAAWAVAALAVLALARMLLVDRRRIHPSRHRAGLTRYRMSRAAYRFGPLLMPVRMAYRALVVSFSWIKVPPVDQPVTMWQYVDVTPDGDGLITARLSHRHP